jgi:serine protease Do
VALAAGASPGQAQSASLPDLIDTVQPKMVKIFGGGGLRRLESWQSGFFISPDGLVATVWSYVLDNETTVVLDDGRRMTAELVGYQPRYEIALLKVDVQEQPCFQRQAGDVRFAGTPVLAFSNLYGVATGNEKCSVQAGVVSAIVPLQARRGVRRMNYQGPALILDAVTSNPGAAGGAVTDRQGRLLGMIGREARSEASDLWLNFAIPASAVFAAVDSIREGRPNAGPETARQPAEPLTLELTGLLLLPDVVERTPPFVDQVIPGGPADVAGLRKDDLIVEIDGRVTTSRGDLLQRLEEIDRDAVVPLTVQRGEQFLNLTLQVNR